MGYALKRKGGFTLKGLKKVFFILIVVTLMAGLFYRFLSAPGVTETTEFLFDTPCSIKVYSKTKNDAVKKAFQEVARIHRLSDFFSDSSDVSKINRAKSGESVLVDPHIIEMISLSKEVSALSDGAFDITIAPLSTLWKFDEETPVPPNSLEIDAALSLIGRDRLLIDSEASTVTKDFSETRIDLGGVAKGYAEDIAARILTENGVSSFILDFGGNIKTCGKNPTTKNGLWRVGLQKPFAPTGEYSKVIEVLDKAVATSGTYQRNFTFNGTLYHHIIDPASGFPAVQDFESVTVTLESSALADCLSTAVYVLGKEKGLLLLEKFGATAEFL